jgi:curved DNA-binding protein CbpA
MKRIHEYKTLFDIDGEIKLTDIKKTYRNLVKEWHPDKFPNGGEKAEEAEEKSREIIDAYKFLVSIAPETIESGKEEYNAMINEKSIVDFDYNKRVLKVEFSNGMTYEYFGVKAIMVDKLNDAPKQMRFARRNIFNSFLYRKAMSDSKAE